MDSTASIPETDLLTPTLLFRAGATLYGCHISDAQEIIPLRRTTRLPGAPAFVRGLINVRGTIVTVLDLAVRFDAARAPTADGSILLVRHRERLVGVVVNEVVDVRPLAVEAPDDDARESGAGSGASVMRGVATVDDAAVVILDLDALITQVLLA
ncbi:MAG TPA: chemotaxis protein CheW [Gemmatimonadaceae bacterium]|nr:chemotaxis protein CheW [Gemmatimonadaceae bacterium]